MSFLIYKRVRWLDNIPLQGNKLIQYIDENKTLNNNIDVNNVWAVCYESSTYSSKRGKAREGLPISTRYPSSPSRKWWVP